MPTLLYALPESSEIFPTTPMAREPRTADITGSPTATSDCLGIVVRAFAPPCPSTATPTPRITASEETPGANIALTSEDFESDASTRPMTNFSVLKTISPGETEFEDQNITRLHS